MPENLTVLDKHGIDRQESARVKCFLRSEAGAAVVWLVLSLMMAATLSPWLYHAGVWLADVAAAENLPVPLEWLGAACGRSREKFGRYFDRSLLLSALVLLPLLYLRIKRLRTGMGNHPFSLRPLGGRMAAVQFLAGFAVAAVGLAMLAWFVVANGVFVPREPAPGFGRILSKTLPPMLGASIVEECLFRGLLLGLWLGWAGNRSACAGSSLMFAVMHFLRPPTDGGIALPPSEFSGFVLLGDVLKHFGSPLFFITDFLTLLVLGLILSWVRIRTRSLWMPVGIHAGLVGSFKLVNLLYGKNDAHPISLWWVGEDLKAGALPLTTLLLIAAGVWLVLRKVAPVSHASR